MKIAVIPGSFDPLTNGHLDVIARAAKLFDRLLVSVIINPNKQPLFTLPERLAMLSQVLKPLKKVAIDSFSGLLVTYMQTHNASVIVKGLRAVSDFEYEFQMALMNRALLPSVETIFLMTSSKFAYLSSSLVKEVVGLGGSVRGLVPPIVESSLKKKFAVNVNAKIEDLADLEDPDIGGAAAFGRPKVPPQVGARVFRGVKR